uniref:SCP domain-containing protein n=1 Tax=Trichuris muris TaxID=70415 RepID=A0A5S6QXN1_TRIMR
MISTKYPHLDGILSTRTIKAAQQWFNETMPFPTACLQRPIAHFYSIAFYEKQNNQVKMDCHIMSARKVSVFLTLIICHARTSYSFPPSLLLEA